jgi:predicted AAA+ superfamily ATPase
MNKKLIERSIFQKIWEEIDSHHIILLNGARQVGKTTLLKMLMSKLKSEKNISDSQLHYVDLEDINQLLIWDDQRSAIKTLPDNNQKHYFFIDEFQNAKTIGSTLKVIHDHHPNIKLIITGSASWYLNINESLAGRKIVIPIWPFSFKEYLTTILEQKEWLRLYQETTTPSENIISLLNSHLFDYLLFGGYPEVVTMTSTKEKIEKLKSLISAYLRKDIKIWNYNANTLEVQKLLSLLASQIGSQLSLSHLSNNSNLGQSIVSNRMELLQNTFILHFLPPFFKNKQKEIIKSPKVFLIDTGIRNSLLNITSILPKTEDFGALAENFVTTELLKKNNPLEKIYFWRTRQGQEVDIIIKRKDKIIPIEVKGGNYKNVPSGLKSFIRTYQPQEAYVLNWSIAKDEQYKNCLVKFRPIWFVNNI